MVVAQQLKIQLLLTRQQTNEDIFCSQNKTWKFNPLLYDQGAASAATPTYKANADLSVS